VAKVIRAASGSHVEIAENDVATLVREGDCRRTIEEL